MVETVSAQPLAAGQGSSATAVRLEPETELKAKVEANLPGGVVRLSTDTAKLDLRLPVKLPPGSDVLVSVSGTRANPTIRVTTPQVLPGEGGVPGPARQTPAAAPPQQARPAPLPAGQLPPATGPATPVLPSSAQGTSNVLASDLTGQKAARGPGPASGQPAAPMRQPPLVLPARGASAVAAGAQSVAGGEAARPLSAGGASASPALAAGRPGADLLKTVAADTQGNTGQPGQQRVSPPGSAAAANQGTAARVAAGIPVPPTGPASGTPVSEGLQTQAGAGLRPPPPTADTALAKQPSGPVQPGFARAGPVPSSPQLPLKTTQRSGGNQLPPQQSESVAQTTARGGAAVAAGTSTNTAQSPQGSALQATVPNPGPIASRGTGANAGSVASPVSGPLSGPASGSLSGPGSYTVAGPISGTLAEQSAGSGRPAAGPLPSKSDKPAPIPPALAGGGVSGVRTGGTEGQAPPPQGGVAGKQPPRSGVIPAGQGLPDAGPPRAGESLRIAQNQPYKSAGSGASVQTGPSPASNAASDPKPVNQVARIAFQALGEQQSGIGNLFAQVGTLVSAQAAGQVSLPDPVVKAMQQILGLRLNAGQNLSAADLQQSMRMSGQLREADAALPRGSGQTTQLDLKSVLLSFRSLLQQYGAEALVARPAAQPKPPSRQEPPQGQTQSSARAYLPGNGQQSLQTLMQETDAALARIRMTQVVNTGLAGDERAQTASRPMDLVFELPLSLGQETGVLQMQVGRDGKGQGGDADDEAAWRLRFALDLTATGPLEAAVSLRGGGTFVSLWVERSDTYENLQALQDTMLASFADAGLNLQEFRLVRGLPPKAAARYGTLVDRQS